jgi:hypothetical protein
MRSSELSACLACLFNPVPNAIVSTWQTPSACLQALLAFVAVALKLVVGTLGLIDKTVAAHQEAADELKNLQEDLEDLQTQMVRIHGTLEVLASNTKDRGFKKVLREYVQGCPLVSEKYPNSSFSHHGDAAIAELCTALDETFVALEGLTDQTKAKEFKLYSLALPNDARSLAFVQAILRDNFAPSPTTDLLKCLRDMRSEIQKCLRKLDTAFQHVWNLYNAITNGLTRVATKGSVLSTSTTLTARIKLVSWLKHREDTWRLSRQRKSCQSCHSLTLQIIEPAINEGHVVPTTREGEKPTAPGFGSGNGSKLRQTRKQMRAFKKVWAEFDSESTGYLRRDKTGPFFAVCHSRAFSI